MSYLFISHSSADDDAVTSLYHRLVGLGIDSWVDHENGIGPADNWNGQIQNALNNCEVGLLILSKASAHSSECEAEYRRILALGKRLYIALIEPISKEDFPWRLTTIQYIDLTESSEIGIQTLVDAIQNNSNLDVADTHVQLIRPLTSRDGVDPRLFIPIFGRGNDLENIKQLLNSGRPTFITGIGGLGKSRLAYEIATQIANVNGVVWHVCSDISRPEMVMELLKSHFNMALDTPNDKVLVHLRTNKRLIVIDNAESIEDDMRRKSYIKLVNQLSQSSAQVLITSRFVWDDLNRAHEYAPQTLPQHVATDIAKAMCEIDGIELNHTQIKQLVRKAYQHPRLIEWAINLIKRRDVGRVFRTLDSLQGRKVQDALHEMILQTVEQMKNSDDDYGKMAVETLKCFNVCRGGFTFKMIKTLIQSVTDSHLPQDDDDIDEVLDLLIQWKFIRRNPQSKRYNVDPIVIVTVGENSDLYHSHYKYYLDIINQHRYREDYASLDVESDNLNIAFKRKVESKQYVDAFWLLQKMRSFLSNRGRFVEQFEWFQDLVPMLESSDDQFLKGTAYLNLGNVFAEYQFGNRRENLHKSIAAYQKVFEFWKSDDNHSGYAQTHSNIGHRYRDLSQIENKQENLHKAIDSHREALLYLVANANPLTYARIQDSLGSAYSELATEEDANQNLHVAIRSYQLALKIRTPVTAPLAYAATTNNLGATYWRLSHYENRSTNLRKSIDLYNEALKYRTPDTAPLDYATTQYNLGTSYLTLSEIDNKIANLQLTLKAYEQALRFRTPESTPRAYASLLPNLGLVYERMNDKVTAITIWRDAVKYFQQLGMSNQRDLVQSWIDSTT